MATKEGDIVLSMHKISLLLLLALFVLTASISAAQAAPCETGDPFPYMTPAKIGSHTVDPKVDCPKDIQTWMNRVNICAHFSGEPPYNKERAAEIDAALKDNKCDQLGCEFETLFTQYEGDIVYTGVMTGYLESIYGDADSLPKCDQ